MLRRLLNISIYISMLMLGLLLTSAIASIWINPWPHHVSVSKRFHIGVDNAGSDFDIRLVFFNNDNYGPYRGSMMQVDGNPVYDREVAPGDKAGIYYRYFRLGPYVLWTLMVSIWYPIGLFAPLSIIGFFRLIRKQLHKPAGICHHCGYDLRATPDACPECGNAVNQSTIST